MRFLVRRSCHLCEEARPLVHEAARRASAVVDEIDVDTDEALRSAYDARVPVVLGPGDQVLAEGVIDDRRALRKAIRRSRPGG